MNARHTRYQNIPIGKCGCLRDIWLEPESSDRLPSHYEFEGRCSSEQVEIVCLNCNGVTSSFYRKPEIDDKSTKADRVLIGQTVQVKRLVAWVGYAKNTNTVFWSQEDERTKMAAMLAATAGIEVDSADEILRGLHDNGENGHSWLESAARRRARYLLFRSAFTSHPILPIRGLWFMDAERTVMIGGTLRCITGRRLTGSPPGNWDDYDPPELTAQVHHQLYYGYSDDGQGALVYPGDCSPGPIK